MRFRASLIAIGLMVTGAALAFHLFQRQMTSASFAFGTHPDVLHQLEASLEDLKHLADLDEVHQSDYRRRFDDVEKTVHRLQILEHSRDDLRRRYELVTLAIFAAIVIAVSVVYVVRQNRHEPRLERLRLALQKLAQGDTAIEVGDRGRDTLGRIAGMVERTSGRMARDRRRIEALRHLGTWQEAARRHAHEIRTPLTSAQLGLSRIVDLARTADSKSGPEIRQAADEALEDVGRLTRFTRDFTSFARLPTPKPESIDLAALIERFLHSYENAWPSVELRLEPLAGGLDNVVEADSEMIRQVLVNLAENSARALGPDGGRLVMRVTSGAGSVHLDVLDDGPGVPEELRSTIFQPYTTTRPLGEGMGLGLAICRKILLDHGGDLQLVDGKATADGLGGAIFRLTFPTPEESPA